MESSLGKCHWANVMDYMDTTPPMFGLDLFSTSDKLPYLDSRQTDQPFVADYLAQLRLAGFSGDCHLDYGTRLISATDNSVYQQLPQAVVYPKKSEDLNFLLRVIQQDPTRFGDIHFAPRGGGTGTNGQSLGTGIIVDCSKYLTKILSFDPEQQLVTVQPGVILDQLNDFLKPHGFFFPPSVSTSSRATLGGMTGTDASGKGSRIYGKVSDYINHLTMVLHNGDSFVSSPLAGDALQSCLARKDYIGDIYRFLHQALQQNQDEIERQFPKMNRGLTGYNLQKSLTSDGVMDLSYLFAGAEGSLGFIQEICFRVLPIPKYKALLSVRYDQFNAALEGVQTLLQAEPAAIEVIDDKILTLAQGDIIWTQVQSIVGGATDPRPCLGINFVEFISDDAQDLQTQIARAEALLIADQQKNSHILGWNSAFEGADIAAIWEMRKKSVGLLGGLQGQRRAIPFVEDTAVPPENLAPFIREFRQILDQHQVDYGMFGHADVGCLHVRPTLDLCDGDDFVRFRQISDQVTELTLKYGGLLWGEHGKGYRGEYSPFFFGPQLYGLLQQIKTYFDPQNRFNPGKIAIPTDSKADSLTAIDVPPFRADFDLDIDPDLQKQFPKALQCNGNGACFNWDVMDPMCPSYKVTGNRLFSPKGRAGLLREWLRLRSLVAAGDQDSRHDKDQRSDFSHQLYESFQACLSCKACATQCPVKVDIPEMKSKFLELYHQRYRRPARDYLIALLETFLLKSQAIAKWQNLIQSWGVVKWGMRHSIGIVDLPKRREERLFGRSGFFDATGILPADPEYLSSLTTIERQKTVLILLDSFTTHFEDPALKGHIRLLQLLGYRLYYLPCQANGKALHVKGFLKKFAQLTERIHDFFMPFQKLGLPVIALDGATALMFRQEYQKVLPRDTWIMPVLIHEFLVTKLAGLPKIKEPVSNEIEPNETEIALFGHCTEKTAISMTEKNWQKIFAHYNFKLSPVKVGCCGMAGLYGHEAENAENSFNIFQQSWQPKLANHQDRPIAVTGFSCRCQMDRFGYGKPAHPTEILASLLDSKLEE